MGRRSFRRRRRHHFRRGRLFGHFWCLNRPFRRSLLRLWLRLRLPVFANPSVEIAELIAQGVDVVCGLVGPVDGDDGEHDCPERNKSE